MSVMTTDLILGTAGHIDHGKTSLIRALTGVDTDRLPEEKRRGITIELGFAELTVGEYRLGIVDVPGHERFVRNMLAGATGMDLALLVVAADDSVKQQTREHLEILRLLHLQSGVIALTKCDLAEAEWMELVEEEIRLLVAGTFLERAPIVRTSVATGEGIATLCATLGVAAERAATAVDQHKREAPFRMAIDRAFTIAGHGTVVTGSVSSGAARLGDELAIEPAGLQVRVRGLHNHDRPVDIVSRGQRAAINLAGVHHDQIRRGQELATQGHLVPSRLLTVRLALLPSAPRPLKSRSRVRTHVGTAEILSTVVLLDRNQLEPGETAPAQLFLAEPAVTVWNQPFVVRSESPVLTLGGGQVLDPNAVKLRRPDKTTLQFIHQLTDEDAATRASAALFLADFRRWKPDDLARTAGVAQPHKTYQSLREQGLVREVQISPTRKLYLHEQTISRLSDRIAQALTRLHALEPLRPKIDRSKVAHLFDYLGDSALVEYLLSDMQSAGRVQLSDKAVGLAGHGPKLSQNEHKLLQQIIQDYRQAGIEPPTVQQYQQTITRNQQSVPQLVSLAAAEGQLVEIAADLYMHADAEQQIRGMLAGPLSAGDGLTMSEIRDILKTTRKYAVPICEYLDRVGFTKRVGDTRVAGEYVRR